MSKVILLSHSNSWINYFEQVGIVYEIYSTTKSYSTEEVFISPIKTPADVCNHVQNLVSNGGVLITESICNSREILNHSKFHFFKGLFWNLTFLDFFEQLHANVVMKRIHHGINFILPFDLQTMFMNYHVSNQSIKSNINKHLYVREFVPLIPKKLIHSFIINILKQSFKILNKPFIHKWYWPKRFRTSFSFRADMDGGFSNILDKYIKEIYNIRAYVSMFVCGQAYQNNSMLKLLDKLGIETGNHTYTHYVFNNKNNNNINIRLTENLLAQVGIIPIGYVGPAYFWHPSMYDVLETKGYLYTSSFGLSHDSLPFFPLKPNGGTYDLVEIPFHCIGDLFPKYGLELNAPEVFDFFDRLIEKKYMAGEPIFLYGHPDMPGRMGDHPELVESICRMASSYSDVWCASMGSVAKWWRERHATTGNLVYDQEKGVLWLQDFEGNSSVTWCITMPDGRWFLIDSPSLQGGVQLDQLSPLPKLTVPGPHDVGEMVPCQSKFNLRHWLYELRRARRRKSQKTKQLYKAYQSYQEKIS